jgi:perosamine synthetase
MKLEGKTVLVTGGAGFIGSHLVDALADCRIRVLDDLSTGSKSNLADACRRSNVKLIIGDIRDRDCVARALDGVDAVFHLACRGVRHSIGNPIENHEVNATGTLVLLSEARRAGVQRFVHVSSSEVYGTARQVPMDELHPTLPETVYGASKLAGECYARAYCQTYGFPTVVIRPFNNFGPRSHHEGDSGEVIPRFVVWAMNGKPPVIFGDGSQTRDFLYVEDTAYWLIRAAECDDLVGQTINLGSGEETAIRTLAEMVYDEVAKIRIAPEFHPRRPGDVDRHRADVTRAQQTLGFHPRFSLAEGIRRVARSFREKPENAAALLDQMPTVNWTPTRSDKPIVSDGSARPKIPITIPLLGREEEEAIAAVVRTGWVAQGPRVAEFERIVAEYCGVREAVALSSCTAALHLSLLALGIGAGDEVICPSMSFIATANAIRHAGATPVFADVDASTYNLDPDATEAVITPRTRAILLVHQIGLPADIDRFQSLAAKHGLKIVEDAACALGSRYRGRPIGGHCEMACFSFHPRKLITTGEGGMITTNNASHANTLRLLRQHGMSVPDTVRHAASQVITESYLFVGYNYRMTDLQAAMGIEQMKRLEEILRRRRELASRYREALNRHPWLKPPYVPEFADFNYQSYAVQLTAKAPISRDELMQRLLDQRIATRRGIMLSHAEPAYAGYSVAKLPQSEAASSRSILLPLYPQMTDAEQDTVLAALFDAAGLGRDAFG